MSEISRNQPSGGATVSKSTYRPDWYGSSTFDGGVVDFGHLSWRGSDTGNCVHNQAANAILLVSYDRA